MTKKNGLRYVGDGSALDDIPARDLSDAELDELASTVGVRLMGHGGRVSLTRLLIASGLYADTTTAEAAPAADIPSDAPKDEA